MEEGARREPVGGEDGVIVSYIISTEEGAGREPVGGKGGEFHTLCVNGIYM